MEPIKNCKICGRALYLAKEKNSGVCTNCERSPAGGKCLKCGAKLLLTPEFQTRLCQRCRGIAPTSPH